MRGFIRMLLGMFAVAAILIVWFLIWEKISLEIHKRDQKIMELQFKTDAQKEIIDQNRHKAFKLFKDPMIRRIMCSSK